MKSTYIFFAILFLASSIAHAEKTTSTPLTEEQCRKNVEKNIIDHKALTNPTEPDKVPDDSFVANMKRIQQSKGSCEAWNQYLDSYN
jgi:hypothetical protein